MKARDVSRPGAALQVHELSLDADPVRDVPDERFIRAPVTRGEIVAIAFFVSSLVVTLAGLAALIALALLAWSLP